MVAFSLQFLTSLRLLTRAAGSFRSSQEDLTLAPHVPATRCCSAAGKASLKGVNDESHHDADTLSSQLAILVEITEIPGLLDYSAQHPGSVEKLISSI